MRFMLMPGWRNLLVNTHLRQGAESPDWKKHVRVLDQVFQHLDPTSDPTASPGYMEPEELIAHIESGLDSISYEPGQRIPLVNSLRQVISGHVAPGEMPTIALAENTIAEDLGFAEEGTAWKEALAGTFDLDGDLPVNPDGGLKSFGHPIGASGLRMLFECWLQLRGEAPPERQIDTDKTLGLTHNLGGQPGACVSFVSVVGSQLG